MHNPTFRKEEIKPQLKRESQELRSSTSSLSKSYTEYMR
jgi:hypothetical protein